VVVPRPPREPIGVVPRPPRPPIPIVEPETQDPIEGDQTPLEQKEDELPETE